VTSDVDGTHTTEGRRIGLAVGLFAPTLLASVAVGAVVGGVIGEFAGSPRRAGYPGHSDS